MNELIWRSDAIKAITDEPTDAHYPSWYVDKLKGVPSAQPDIITCGDCKWRIRHDKRCGYWNHGVKPDMWCSQAERREDG